MKKTDSTSVGGLNLPDDFFKQFKDKAAFQTFFSELFKSGVEAMLRAELSEHLGYEKHAVSGHGTGNSRNGASEKTVKTESLGNLVLAIPRDRVGSFEPVLVPKHSRMSEQLEQNIVSLYARGMSTSDIETQIQDMYGVSVSAGTISNLTNRVLDDLKAWRERPLSAVYFTVWMDGIQFNVRQNGKIIKKTVFLVIGLKPDGVKEVLGMWLNETESASFWLSVLTDLKARGVKDILIACTDNLTGFTNAIAAAFPKTTSQLCIVHQIRNACKFVNWKERKEFCDGLKAIYAALDRDRAAEGLDQFEAKWGKKYGYAVKSWRDNWVHLTAYFDFPLEIRKLIYTTNAIESLNAGIRKYTNVRVIFPDDQAALKAVWMAVNNLEKRWTRTISDWGIILNAFIITFGERTHFDSQRG